MIARGLLLLCAVALTQAFFPGPPHGQLIPIPIKPIVHTKVIPVVKYIREPVYIEKVVRVPHYIERAIPVPYRGGSAGGSAGSGASNLDFGLNAQIEDADTVNIVAGVSGATGVSGGFSDNNGFDNNNGFNDDGFGRGLIGGRGGIQRQTQPRVSVSQTSISHPSARISQPKIGRGHGGHKMPSHFGHF